jgi:hypothetical protein
MIEDLTFVGEEDPNRERLPGLAVPGKCDNRTLLIREWAYRHSNIVGAHDVLFVEVDDATISIEDQRWEETTTIDPATGIETIRRLDQEKWTKLMRWPRPVTVPEVEQFQANARARAEGEIWQALQFGSPESAMFVENKLT